MHSGPFRDTRIGMALDDTGERLVPGSNDPDLRNEHLARYRFAEPLATGRRILDAGCGTAYGAELLAAAGAEVHALDRDRETVAQVRNTHPRLRLVRGDCARLPFRDRSFDLVVAFEVIEHLRDWDDLIREAARILRPSGAFMVSTPNRAYYNSGRERPNPFHVHEFDFAEFRAALAAYFVHCAIYLENHAPAIAVTSRRDRQGRAHFESAASDPEHAHFLIGVCSMEAREAPPDFAYLPQAGNVLRERELHLRKLNDWVAALEARHSAVERRMSRELSRLPYRILRRLRLAPQVPVKWTD